MVSGAVCRGVSSGVMVLVIAVSSLRVVVGIRATRRESRRPRAVLPPRSAPQGSPPGSLTPYLTLLPERAERRPQVLGEERRLFPGREVPAFGELVVIDEFGKCPLRPAPRGWIELVREDAHGNWDGDAFGIEIPFAPILPIETGARNCRVRQPGERDVVEDVVAREALRLPVKDARDERIAARVVIKEIGRQTDGGIRDCVQRLRSQPHLEAVTDALCIDEAQPLVRDLLVG